MENTSTVQAFDSIFPEVIHIMNPALPSIDIVLKEIPQFLEELSTKILQHGRSLELPPALFNVIYNSEDIRSLSDFTVNLNEMDSFEIQHVLQAANNTISEIRTILKDSPQFLE